MWEVEMDARELARRMSRECLVVRVRAINRVVTRLYDNILRGHGLRASQMSLLVAIVGYGPVQPSQLAQVLELEKSTLSRDVDRMIERGWIQTLPHEDGRSHFLQATPAGKALLEQVSAAWEEGQKRARQQLGVEGVEALMTLAAPFFQIPEDA
jgi:DNA-binding MarR family transcriptional regulator